jgi:hypothetical protein
MNMEQCVPKRWHIKFKRENRTALSLSIFLTNRLNTVMLCCLYDLNFFHLRTVHFVHTMCYVPLFSKKEIYSKITLKFLSLYWDAI